MAELDLKNLFLLNLKILKLLEDPTRVRLIGLLLMFESLNITQLSQMMRRTKPAITHQISKFVEIGLVEVQDVFVRGTITAKVYSLNPHYFTLAKITIGANQKFDPSKAFQISLLELEDQRAFFTFIQQILSNMKDFYDVRIDLLQKIQEPFSVHLPAFHYLFWPITEEQHEFYITKHEQLMDELVEFGKTHKNEAEKVHPYLIINGIIPIKEIIDNE